eukprot:GGOE01010213.1.p1 GENE.GGOE01010213.1~~GGOE01010213.1.p1  ORF type:complete len:610 (+),score=116.41 GGOE01010213.1:30-1859(+)
MDHDCKESDLADMSNVPHPSSEASSSATTNPAFSREPPLLQRMLFALKTIKASFSQSPNHRALLVVSASHLRQYSHHLHCLGSVVQTCVDPSTTPAGLPPFKLLITSTVVCHAILTASQIPLTEFHLIMVDQDLGAEAVEPSVQDLIRQWQRLGNTQRPLYVDLFSLGKQQPKPSREDAETSSCVVKEEPEEAALSVESEDSEGEDESKIEDCDPQSGPPRKLLLYPYSTASVKLTVLNSSAVFMTYCESLLGPGLNRMRLFKYSRWKKHRSNVLCAIYYPSPEGYIKMTKRQAQKALKGRSLEQLCAKDDTTGISRGDLQERWFFFVVVMDMVARGLLDEDLAPTPHVITACRSLPPPSPVEVPRCKSSQPAPPPPAKPLPSAPAVAPSLSPDPAISEEDPQMLLRHLAAGTEGLCIAYDTIPVGDQGPAAAYLTTVLLQHHSETFSLRGEVSSQKNAAEHSAALAAVKFIIRGGLGALSSKEPPPPVHLPVSVRGPVPHPLQTVVPPRPLAPLPGPALLSAALGAVPPIAPKARLQELVAWISRAQNCSLSLRFTSLPLPGGFVGTVYLMDSAGGHCAFTGEVAFTAEQSEEFAAQKAIHAFSCLQL